MSPRRPPQPPDATPAEAVRSGLRGLFRLALWVVPIGALVWVLWTYFANAGGGLPDNPDEFLRSYSELAAPLAIGGSAPPGILDYKRWIEYFDSDSRDFFDRNCGRILRRYHAGSTEDLGKLSADAIRLEAMKWVIGNPPLNGQFRIERVAPRAEGDVADADVSTASGRFRIVLRKERGDWRITEMGGLKDRIVKTVEVSP